MSLFPILLAEDDPVSRKMLETILTKSGYKVVTAENGKKALDLYKEYFFPIILTDWMMPEMDGFELCKAIRTATADRYVFIILLTAKDSKDDIIQGFEAGADDYLTKPINYAELVARIKTGTRILELEQSLIKANEEIKKISLTDALTGAYNHRYIDDNLPREIKRSLRYNHCLSLIMADLDHFKEINDRYGHQSGDLVLKAVTDVFNQTIRHQLDWIARYGGEEFLIVLPETALSEAELIAERLRKAIEHKKINFRDEYINITVSLGVSGVETSYNSENITAELMIRKADKFLYRAKNNGRNRVESGLVNDS